MKTTQEIGQQFYDEWYHKTGRTEMMPDLIGRAIDHAIDQLNDQNLASRLTQAEKDRDSWMEAHLKRGEELGRLQKRLDEQAEQEELLRQALNIMHEQMDFLESVLLEMEAELKTK